jgi:adenine-specific DNA-methyltransferase
MDKRYRNPDGHHDGPWKATPLYAKRTPTEKELGFSFTFKNGVVWSPPAGTSPRFPAAELSRMDANDEIWFGAKGDAIPSRKTFLGKLSVESPPSPTIWLHSEAGNNHEAREESKLVNAAEVFGTPKPEKLLMRIMELATNVNDVVLDSFLGSGTTAAVAHKMGRRWIGIEMGEHARTHCLPRLSKVVDGEPGGISSAVNWQGGGGFRFMRLGEPVFEQDGRISPSVRFAPLAAYLWFAETREPHGVGTFESPLLGVHGDTAIVLLYNGILGDRRPQGGNVLTDAVWEYIHALLPDHNGPWLVYGEASRLQPATRKHLNIEFKQIPYDIRVR